jgi:hypothetical protein
MAKVIIFTLIAALILLAIGFTGGVLYDNRGISLNGKAHEQYRKNAEELRLTIRDIIEQERRRQIIFARITFNNKSARGSIQEIREILRKIQTRPIN